MKLYLTFRLLIINFTNYLLKRREVLVVAFEAGVFQRESEGDSIFCHIVLSYQRIEY